MIYIGIDPGRNTGIAVWDSKSRSYVELKTGDFWDCMATIKKYWKSPNPFRIVVENPNLNQPVWAGGTGLGMKQKLKIAQDVGRNKEDAYLIITWCERQGVDCTQMQPRDKKWNHKEFIQVTKLPLKRSNEHLRDAARLVFGI